MKLLGKILYGVMVSALVLILCLNLLLTGVQVLQHKDYPELFGWSRAVVLTGSMEPAIPVGAMIVVHRESVYETGDIITFAETGASVTHRIVETTSEGFVTKGDANNTADREVVSVERVYGKVVAVVPGVGNVALFLSSPPGLMLVIFLSILLLWGKDMVSLFQKAGRRESI